MPFNLDKKHMYIDNWEEFVRQFDTKLLNLPYILNEHKGMF